LPRPAKEAFAICLEQNKECHQSLKSAEKNIGSDWEFFFGSLALGMAAGIVFANQLHH
jgi:hypothetical protein